MSFKTTATIASFGGKLLKLTHDASTVGCEMALNLYLPPKASAEKKVPVIFYLAGLTCTGDNGAEKGFFQSAASEKGIAVVYPDTSPSKFLEESGEDLERRRFLLFAVVVRGEMGIEGREERISHWLLIENPKLTHPFNYRRSQHSRRK